MIEKTFYCDGCARKKRDTEAWWQVQSVPARDITGCVIRGGAMLLIMKPFEESGAEHWHCYCSQQCAIVKVTGYMGDIITRKGGA